MTYDISKASLAVLLILAMIISVLSTLTILNSFEESKFKVHKGEYKINNNEVGQGNVKFNIIHKKSIEPEKASVSLQINRNGDY
jgi:hypothetical protein